MMPAMGRLPLRQRPFGGGSPADVSEPSRKRNRIVKVAVLIALKSVRSIPFTEICSRLLFP
jgi:hypothetical protein